MKRKRDKNMYDVLLKEKNSLYNISDDLKIHAIKEIPDDLVRYKLSLQMSDEIYSDMEKMTGIMVNSIVGGILGGRKQI